MIRDRVILVIFVDRTVFLLNNNGAKSISRFLFVIVDRIPQTISVAENSAAVALQENIVVSDRFKCCLKTMVDRDGHK